MNIYPGSWKAVVLCALCLMAVAPASTQVLAGEQIVRVDDQQESEKTQMGREQALLLAVVREAQSVVPGALDPDRQRLLARFLESRHRTYILTYSRLGANPARPAWQVHVNSQALTHFLQGLGLYYTPDQSLPYTLHLSTPDQRGQERIFELERLSGCVQGDVRYPVLTVQIASDGGWKGVLESRTESWTASDQDLDSLWLSLWSKYFHSPEGVQPFVHSVDVHIKGWSTMSALSGFSSQLNSWVQLVVHGVLLQVTGDSGGLHGWWRIQTSRRQGLLQKLEEYVQSRGLQLKIRDASAE